MSQIKKGGLGRGLGALLKGVDVDAPPPPVSTDDVAVAEQTTGKPAGQAAPGNAAASAAAPALQESIEPGDRVVEVDIEKISRGTYQPRRYFDDEALQELADSIAAQGLIQPIILRQRAGGYELIAGERRWRAAKLIGLAKIPAIIREMTDGSVAAVTLIENIQREDLNPLEEAQALQRLKTEFDMTHQDVADAVGRSRAAVSNLIRLLDLDSRVADMLLAGKIEMGHARAMLSLPAEQQHLLAMKVYAGGMTVRATEALVKEAALDGERGKPAKSKPAASRSKSSHIRTLENDLSEKLGTRVSIEHGAGNKGSISISYHSLDELDGILKHIR
ncbi:MAG: ParB/RepB/Spo0J family partition protein [Pseudomonadota bacterium]